MDNLPNILVVDDTPENVSLLKYMLKETRANVITAYSGPEALALIKDKHLSLALIDIMMPEMDGYELAHRIKNQNGSDKLPIIFLTAFNAGEEHILKGFDAGGVDYIVKPFNKKILISKINVFLELFKQKQVNVKQQFNLDKALEIGNIGIWERTFSSEELLWTEQNYRNFGLSSNVHVDFNIFLSIIHDNDRVYVQEAWNKALQGEQYEIEYRLNQEPQLKWIREKAHLSFDIDGKPLRAIGFTQDITIRKTAEEELRIKEAFNYAVFQYNPIPAIVVDNNGKIVDFNIAQLKFSRNNLILGDVMYVDYASKHKMDMFSELLHCIKTLTPKTFPEIKYKQKYLSITIAPFIQGAIITCIDITQRKKAELTIQKAKEQLEKLTEHQIEVREEERARISLIIHDELGQAMTALKMDLNWLRQNFSEDEPATDKLDKMIVTVKDVIKRVQRLSSDLRPGMLDDLGLGPAVEWYCNEFSERTGIHCALNIEEFDIKQTHTELTLYRILQEALTNVIRHSQASKVDIELYKEKNTICMDVIDNGVGFPKEKLEAVQSLGIMGIYQRVKQCGGSANFKSEKDNGTVVSIKIPVNLRKINNI